MEVGWVEAGWVEAGRLEAGCCPGRTRVGGSGGGEDDDLGGDGEENALGGDGEVDTLGVGGGGLQARGTGLRRRLVRQRAWDGDSQRLQLMAAVPLPAAGRRRG